MDNLRNQMVGLMQGIATSARERRKGLDTIKKETAETLRMFGRERMVMAAGLQAELATARTLRASDVRSICDNADTMCQNFRQEHGRMGRDLRQSLGQSRQAVVRAVTALRAQFSKESANCAKEHRHMAKTLCAGLLKDHRHRTHATQALIGGFTKARHHMARTQNTGLARDRRSRSEAVTELMQGFHLSREKMAHELMNSLTASRREARPQLYGTGQFTASPAKASAVAALRQAGLLAPSAVAQMPDPEPPAEDEEVQELHANAAIADVTRHALGKSGKSKKK